MTQIYTSGIYTSKSEVLFFKLLFSGWRQLPWRLSSFFERIAQKKFNLAVGASKLFLCPPLQLFQHFGTDAKHKRLFFVGHWFENEIDKKSKGNV